MANDEELYGAGLPFFDALKLLAQYAPLIGRAQAIAAAPTAYDKALAIVDSLKWAASKSERTTVDDEAVDHLQAVLKTPEGKAFFEWMVATIGGAL